MEKDVLKEQTHSEFNYAFNNYKDADYDTNGFEEPKETLNWLGKTTVLLLLSKLLQVLLMQKVFKNL